MPLTQENIKKIIIFNDFLLFFMVFLLFFFKNYLFFVNYFTKLIILIFFLFLTQKIDKLILLLITVKQLVNFAKNKFYFGVECEQN